MTERSEDSFWGVFSGLLGIVSLVLAVAIWLFPAGTTPQKIVLFAFTVSTAVLIYLSIVAFRRGTLDRALTVSTILTICLGAICAFMLGSDGDSAGPQQAPTQTVTVITTQVPSAPTVAGSTPTGSTSAPPATQSTPALLPFDSSDVAAYVNGTANLTIGEYGLLVENTFRWGSSNGYGGAPRSGTGNDVTFDESGMTGREGTQFAVLRSGARRSYPTCRAVSAWVPSLTWDQVGRGTFVCLKTPRGRRGLMRFDELPDFESERPAVRITGVTWVPIVDR